MKTRHLLISLLFIMGCSDKKSQEEAQDLDRIVQEMDSAQQLLKDSEFNTR